MRQEGTREPGDDPREGLKTPSPSINQQEGRNDSKQRHYLCQAGGPEHQRFSGEGAGGERLSQRAGKQDKIQFPSDETRFGWVNMSRYYQTAQVRRSGPINDLVQI
jgi:hypothetical protein